MAGKTYTKYLIPADDFVLMASKETSHIGSLPPYVSCIGIPPHSSSMYNLVSAWEYAWSFESF